jgi:KUP system potassium uptake protein
MVHNGEVDVRSRYESLNKITVVILNLCLSEEFLSDSVMIWHEKLIMNTYFLIKKLSLSEEKNFLVLTTVVLLK